MDLRIIRSFCPHRENTDSKVEFFWSEPITQRKYPLVILVHGHNAELRLGGRTDLFTGLFEYFADNGLVAVSMSQPGYAGSSGPSDYCGPFSQAALSSVIDYFYSKHFIEPDHIAVYGLSRGATVAALTAAKDERIKALVLTAGLYNLLDGYGDLNSGIKEALNVESDGSLTALKERSPRYCIEKITVPTLMIHGARDDVAHPRWAKETFQSAIEMGKRFRLELFEKHGHGIPFSTCAELAGNFLADLKFIGSPGSPYRLSFKTTL